MICKYVNKLIDLTKQTKKRKVNMIIIHCSATPPNMDIGYNEIKQWHLKRGWSDIGYHFIIRRDGTLETGRDTDYDGDIFEEVGAHTYGYNKNSLSICMVGGIDTRGKADNNFRKEQWKVLGRTVRILKAEFPNATVHGHREFANKACPSFDVQKWLAENNI